MATTASNPAGSTAKITESREYVVLSLNDGPGEWQEIGRGHGTTAKQAMASVVEGLPKDEQEGTFVAVPVRNWQPLTRKTETVVKASWS